MLSSNAVKSILALTERYPARESALMPALSIAQKDNNNYLDRATTAEVAKLVGVTEAQAYGVVTYYTLYNEKPVGVYHIQVDTNIPATLMGAGKILDCIKKKLDIGVGETTGDGLFTLSEVECLGSCGSCPVIQVNDVYYENMTIEKTKVLLASLRKRRMPDNTSGYHWHTACNILLKNRGTPNAASVAVYTGRGGYRALEKAREMAPEKIIELVKYAVVRGRGGAGFPMGMKWGFLPKNDPRPVYLICNADEGEPGTFKDRQIMEYDPHLLIEGMAIAARAIGAKKAFIYIRGEFEWIARILEQAVEEATKEGLLGDLDIVVHRGAGSYVCGEETALIESLEGKRGYPRIKPPFPANSGLYGCPTIVNNVETLSLLPFIVENGSDAFRAIGTDGNFGPKLFGVSGMVNKPGVYEFPLGVPLATILEAAGGVKGKLKAVIVGGLSVPILRADELDGLRMDFDSCANRGTALGSGGIMVITDEFSIPELAYRTIRFYAHESCGQCAPCRYGADSIQVIMEKLLAGEGTTEDIAAMREICATVNGVTICPTGEAFTVPIKAMIEKFREEFDALVR